MTNLTGTLVLVDDQIVALSNLQRYVLTTQQHIETSTLKVGLAASTLPRAADEESPVRLRVESHPLLWGDYLRMRGNYVLDRVVTAVDTIDARLDVQAALPRRVLNAWTQQGDLGVSRHLSFGSAPCLSCIYVQRSGGRSEAEVIAESMRVPEPAGIIRELLHSNAPIDEAFVRGVAARRDITDDEPIQALLRYVGVPLRAFYQEVFCGGLMLQLEGTSEGVAGHVEAPIAFQSALAGVMIAAEIVIDAMRSAGIVQGAVRPRTVIDLMRPLSVYQPSISRRTDGLCLCEDADYLNAYHGKYDSDTFDMV